jgi:hypothetical protein
MLGANVPEWEAQAQVDLYKLIDSRQPT